MRAHPKKPAEVGFRLEMGTCPLCRKQPADFYWGVCSDCAGVLERLGFDSYHYIRVAHHRLAERVERLEKNLWWIAFVAHHSELSKDAQSAALQTILNAASRSVFDNPKYTIEDGHGGKTVDLRPTREKPCPDQTCPWCKPKRGKGKRSHRK